LIARQFKIGTRVNKEASTVTALEPTTKTSEVETITYTPGGKKRQTYTVKGNKIYNSKGVEVFKKDSKDRNKIFGNLAIQRGEAQIVEHKGKKIPCK